MGKHVGRKNKPGGGASGEKGRESNLKAYDKDTAVFIVMSQELKEEGNWLFQKRDYIGAMSKYEKALKLLPRVHTDVSYLRSNMAACYMQMGRSEYPCAINECNLALEVTPKYSKALLKRARCYEEALNRLDLALRDASTVLNIESNNAMALEISDRVKDAITDRGLSGNSVTVELPPDYVEPPTSSLAKVVKEKKKKSKRSRVEENKPPEKSEKSTGFANKVNGENIETKREVSKEENGNKDRRRPEDKAVVEEKIMSLDEVPKRNVKLVFGEDIRWAELPVSCSLLQVREVICDRFPSLQAVLIKYRDPEGDLVTITSDAELRWAEAPAESQGSFRLYVVEVTPDQDPFMAKLLYKQDCIDASAKQKNQLTCIDDWIIHFAQLFKNYVGLDADEYLDLQELGMKLYSEAMEETVTSEEAQNIFGVAADKFQEMTVVALFNWGNIHMSRARKEIYLTEDASEHAAHEKIKIAYVWALEEYKNAGRRYKEALKIKPDFFEAYLALGQQQFDQAKLMWYYAVSSKVDLKTWPSDEVLYLYNSVEENMEKGMQIWEQAEEQWQRKLSKQDSCKVHLEKLGLDGLFNDMTSDESSETTAIMRSQINLLWGRMLYERSIVEFKLGLPAWNECLEIAIEKFERAGASPNDIDIMVKSLCSNDTSVEGASFKLDEAKKWRGTVCSFRLEPFFRRRISGLHHTLQNS